MTEKPTQEDYNKALLGLRNTMDGLESAIYELSQTDSYLTQYKEPYNIFYQDYGDVKSLLRVTLGECLRLHGKIQIRSVME